MGAFNSSLAPPSIANDGLTRRHAYALAGQLPTMNLITYPTRATLRTISCRSWLPLRSRRSSRARERPESVLSRQADRTRLSFMEIFKMEKHYEDNKALVTAYMHAAFVDRDLSEVERFWGDEMIQHNPTMPNGHDALRSIISKIGPEFAYEPGLTMEDGNFVMVHGRYRGWGPKRWWPWTSSASKVARSSSTGMSCKKRLRPANRPMGTRCFRSRDGSHRAA